MLRIVIYFLLSSLTNIVYLTFCKGDFPDYSQMGKMVSLYKRGDPRSIGNYLPINVASMLSKIFEYAYLNRLNSYLDHNYIMTNEQYKFRISRSTITAVHSFYDTLTKFIDIRECPVGIFYDLSRAILVKTIC